MMVDKIFMWRYKHRYSLPSAVDWSAIMPSRSWFSVMLIATVSADLLMYNSDFEQELKPARSSPSIGCKTPQMDQTVYLITSFRTSGLVFAPMMWSK
jgi:hypothetical protein